MSRYVYRVTARFAEHRPDGSVSREWADTKHYQSKAAAHHRAAVLLGAVEPVDTERFGWLPRAQSVVIEQSAPVDGWQVIAS